MLSLSLSLEGGIVNSRGPSDRERLSKDNNKTDAAAAGGEGKGIKGKVEKSGKTGRKISRYAPSIGDCKSESRGRKLDNSRGGGGKGPTDNAQFNNRLSGG